MAKITIPAPSIIYDNIDLTDQGELLPTRSVVFNVIMLGLASTVACLFEALVTATMGRAFLPTLAAWQGLPPSTYTQNTMVIIATGHIMLAALCVACLGLRRIVSGVTFIRMGGAA
ncbi:hypothetical protein ACOI1H_14775 [Loktanella sp. DJP18]|uniref:hypothetical protein n=1 Tax=Loktanella sp. DJP18 TaxID=3409788 RepID=UPI003BB60ECD